MFSLGANYTKRNHVIICICGFYFPKLRRTVGSLTVGAGGAGGEEVGVFLGAYLCKCVLCQHCHLSPQSILIMTSSPYIMLSKPSAGKNVR